MSVHICGNLGDSEYYTGKIYLFSLSYDQSIECKRGSDRRCGWKDCSQTLKGFGCQELWVLFSRKQEISGTFKEKST